MELLRGKLQPGSGNKPGSPGDVRCQEITFRFQDKVLLEAKCTDKHQMILYESILRKISDEAATLGRTPLVGLQICSEKWLAIPAWAIEYPPDD
jgi:hypothetical protein